MPKLAKQLTVKAIEALRTRRDVDELPDGEGRRVRRLRDGRIKWEVRYWFAGEQRVDEVGFHGGGDGEVLPADARDRARAIRRLARDGIDPRGEAKRERDQKAAEDAARVRVSAVAERWYAGTIASEYRRPEQVRAILDRHILPALGDVPIADLTRGHIADLVESIRDDGARRMADQVLMYVKRLLKYAVAKGHIEQSPAALIGRKDLALTAKPRGRNLAFDELRRVVRWLNSRECFAQEPVRALLKVLVLTGCRTGEALGAKWQHIDLDAGLWHVPPGDDERKAKADRPHLIHLSPQAVAVLAALPRFKGNDWVFASPKVARQAIDEKAAARVLRRAFDGEKRKRSKDWKPDPTAKRKSRLAEPAPLAGIPMFTPHDLRRTFRSRIADLGVLPHVGEKCLNHELSGVLAVYDRGEYLPERKAAFELWGRTVETLLRDDAGNVAVLSRAA